MSCGIHLRHGLGPVWLWCRPAATALIWLLAWEPPYAASVALKRPQKKKKKKEKKKEEEEERCYPCYLNSFPSGILCWLIPEFPKVNMLKVGK